MRIMMIAALAAAALSAMPAAAQSTGQTNQSGSTTNTNGASTGNGTASGSTASGFTTTMTAPSGSQVVFSSTGAASAHVDATPFSVATTSAHAGAFTGQAFNGGSVQGSVQTFGQAAGNVAFTTNGQAATSSFVTHSDFSMGDAPVVTPVENLPEAVGVVGGEKFDPMQTVEIN